MNKLMPWRSFLNGSSHHFWPVSLPALLYMVGVVGVSPGFAQTISAPAKPTAVIQAAKPVTIKLTQFKVIKAQDGKESLVDAATVKPGDIIEYRAVYSNRSDKAVRNLTGELPIPEGLEYLPKSAAPGASLVQAATKNGVFGAEPLVRQNAGKTEPVPYSEYRTLRWNLGQLPAGGEAAISARARVETYVAPQASAVTPQTSAAAVVRTSAAAPGKP